jgi:hypothetical protein
LLERSLAAFDLNGPYIGKHLNVKGYIRSLNFLPKAEPFAYYVSSNVWIYPLYGPDFSRKPVFIPMIGKDFLETMRRKNLRTIFFCTVDEKQINLMRWAVRTGRLVQVSDCLFRFP